MDTNNRRRLTRILGTLVVPAVVATSLVFVPTASAAGLEDYLNLPLTNRLADHGGGGVNTELPTDPATLQTLIDEARASGRAATSYAALLLQYRLVQATTEAGIDLASWNPDGGFAPNRSNMIKSYRYYEDFQLDRRELQWAGMGGQVGGDFGGGIADMEMATDFYDFPDLQKLAGAVINQVESAFGPEAVNRLPSGLRNLADKAGDITTENLRWFIRQIVIMQKAIFSDLMPMHYAYKYEGLAALEEYHTAGLIPDEVLEAWYDVASGDSDRVAAGNAALLHREQFTVVGDLWDEARAYGDGIGSALTYMMTLVGSPSVAGVPPLRNVNSIKIEGTLPDGRQAVLNTPLPDWDWSIFEQRWTYVSNELLPRYRAIVENDWPTMEAKLRMPYEAQFESQRATSNIPKMIGDVLSAVKLDVK